MSDEYRSGFRDGFAAGLEEGKRIQTQPYPAYPTLYDGCPVCLKKFDSPWGYVCANPKCPSKVTCTTTGTNPDVQL